MPELEEELKKEPTAREAWVAIGCGTAVAIAIIIALWYVKDCTCKHPFIL